MLGLRSCLVGTVLAVCSQSTFAMVPCVCPPIVLSPPTIVYPSLNYPSPTYPSVLVGDACPPVDSMPPIAPPNTTPPMVMPSNTPTPQPMPKKDEPKVEPAKPVPAVPDAPKPLPKLEEPARPPIKLEPTPLPKPAESPKTPEPSPTIPNLTLPSKPSEPKAPKLDEPKAPKQDARPLPPLDLTPGKTNKAPEISIPTISESKYLSADSFDLRVVPTEGDRTGDKNRLAIFNYTERAVTLKIAGESYTLNGKSSHVLEVADGVTCEVGTRTTTLKRAADANGWQMIIQNPSGN